MDTLSRQVLHIISRYLLFPFPMYLSQDFWSMCIPRARHMLFVVRYRTRTVFLRPLCGFVIAVFFIRLGTTSLNLWVIVAFCMCLRFCNSWFLITSAVASARCKRNTVLDWIPSLYVLITTRHFSLKLEYFVKSKTTYIFYSINISSIYITNHICNIYIYNQRTNHIFAVLYPCTLCTSNQTCQVYSNSNNCVCKQ
jgi:hypothetical protein